MELLAPAGGEEQLDYAIRFGADAVYLACEKFGMRARATNFSLDDLPRVVELAHARNTKVHLACNVMMHQGEIRQLPEYLEQAAAAQVDALIVGDLGAAALARNYAPNVELHASTQASVCNAEAAKVWHDLGASRIVAAREMSLEELAEMKALMPRGMELEAFAHGAMCMAYSGRCLISDFMTRDRSGIRGNCAQSCRWQYTLMEEWRHDLHFPVEEDGKATYFMNAEDICMLEHLDALKDAGIDSIKIEGRNKKAYYVACVTNAYRQVLDGADPALFMKELESVSHRPYSTGFYYGPGKQTPENLVYLRNTQWAAQVLSVTPQEDGTYRAEVRCRDRFDLTDAFEVLSPHRPIRPIHLSELVYLPSSRYEMRPDKVPTGWDPDEQLPEPTTQGNHPSERYLVTVDVPVEPYDIIRVLR